MPKLTNQITATVSILFRSTTYHNLTAAFCVAAPLCSITTASSVFKKTAENRQETTHCKHTAPSGLKLTIGNDPLVKAIFTHSRPCPMSNVRYPDAIGVSVDCVHTGRNKDAEPGRTSCAYRAVVSIRPEIGLDPVRGDTSPPICRCRPPKTKFQSRPGRRRSCQTLLLVSHSMFPTSSLQKKLFRAKNMGLCTVARNGTEYKLWQKRRR